MNMDVQESVRVPAFNSYGNKYLFYVVWKIGYRTMKAIWGILIGKSEAVKRYLRQDRDWLRVNKGLWEKAEPIRNLLE